MEVFFQIKDDCQNSIKKTYLQVYCGRHEVTYLYTYLYKLYTDKDGVLKRAAFERSMTQTVRC